MLEANVDVDSSGTSKTTSLHISSLICDARLMWPLIRTEMMFTL